MTKASARELALGLTMGSDHAGGPPLAQVLAPIFTLLPFGDLELRAAIGLSIPGALASFLVMRRAGRTPSASGRGAATAIALAMGALAGAILSRAAVATSMTVIGVELALFAVAVGTKRRPLALPSALAAFAFAAWCAPLLAPAGLGALAMAMAILAKKELKSTLWAGAWLFLPTLVVLVAFLAVRDRAAWCVLGRAWHEGPFATARGPLLEGSTMVRAAWATPILAGAALLVAGKQLAADDRASALVAALGVVTTLVTRAEGGPALVVVVLLPTAAAALGALHIAVDRAMAPRENENASSRAGAARALAWIVPALAVGWSARAVEEEIRSRHVSVDVGAARAFAPIATLGAAPARVVIATEDDESVIAFTRARAGLGLRPDARLLPLGNLLFGGSARTTTLTIAAFPQANVLLRGYLSNGVLAEADVSPLTQQVPLFSTLPAARLLGLARHVDATGEALLVALERIDPSDRRLHRTAIERRLRFVLATLTDAPDDPIRRALRASALREARLLSVAYDREGSLAALERARTLGADPVVIDAASARVKAKAVLENELD